MAGTLKAFRYHSAALDRDETAQVYVPAGTPPAEGWPVLYLLHGLHGSGTDWETLGNISATVEGLLASQRIKPVLIVMPNGQNSWYVDSSSVDGPGDYATAISRDLPQAIEAAFPVATDPAHRAIGGISMGGYGALRLALSHPERYCAVATLSPAIWQNIPIPVVNSPHDRSPALAYFTKLDPDTVTIGRDLPPNGDHFGGAFGTPFDPKRFNDANVFTLLQQAMDAKKVLPAIYLSVGDDDSHLLWRGSIAFFETMQMDRAYIDFRVTDGDHNWLLWKKSLADALVFASDHFGKALIR